METAAPLQGRWFDGRSSRPRLVTVHLTRGAAGPVLRLQPQAAHEPPLALGGDEVGWPERFSRTQLPAAVTVDLRAHGSLEVTDVARWQDALQAAGERPSLAQRMQLHWRVFAGVLLLAGAGLFAFFRWGTPWIATHATREVPLAWETALAQRAMQELDESHFKPSKLPAARQAQLREGLARLTARIGPGLRRYPGYAPAFTLSFRSGLGANAMALPGGALVVTDALVERADKDGLGDEALLGVLAHEIGHVMHRHTTRMAVEQGVLNAGLGMALGDLSSVLTVGGSLLTGLAYRRGHEAEADCFAVALMREAGLPTAPMAGLLLGIDEAARESRKDGSRAALSGLLSSHPQTPERAQRIREGRREGC